MKKKNMSFEFMLNNTTLPSLELSACIHLTRVLGNCTRYYPSPADRAPMVRELGKIQKLVEEDQVFSDLESWSRDSDSVVGKLADSVLKKLKMRLRRVLTAYDYQGPNDTALAFYERLYPPPPTPPAGVHKTSDILTELHRLGFAWHVDAMTKTSTTNVSEKLQALTDYVIQVDTYPALYPDLFKRSDSAIDASDTIPVPLTGKSRTHADACSTICVVCQLNSLLQGMSDHRETLLKHQCTCMWRYSIDEEVKHDLGPAAEKAAVPQRFLSMWREVDSSWWTQLETLFRALGIVSNHDEPSHHAHG